MVHLVQGFTVSIIQKYDIFYVGERNKQAISYFRVQPLNTEVQLEVIIYYAIYYIIIIIYYYIIILYYYIILLYYYIILLLLLLLLLLCYI